MVLVAMLTGCGQVRGECEGCYTNQKLYEFQVEVNLGGYSESETFHLCKKCVEESIENAKIQAENYDAEIKTSCKKLRKD